MTLVEDNESDISSSTISTNATTSNLPGPGRTLDLFYQFAGRKLERVVGRVAQRAGYTGQHAEELQSLAEYESSGFSTNATTSNLPGPGRTLGLFYQFAGRKLEHALNKAAHDMGYGPNAVERRILTQLGVNMLALRPTDREDLVWKYSWSEFRDWKSLPVLVAEKRQEVSRDCAKLLAYTHSRTVSTQRDALRRIIALAALCPDLQEIFREHQGSAALNSVSHLLRSRQQFLSESDNAHLLSESRRAMLFMEENERNAVGKLVLSSVPTGRQAMLDGVQLWYTHVRRLYFQCVDKRRPEYMFVSMRYLTHPGIAAFIAESLLVHHQARYFFEYLFMVADTVPREFLEREVVLKVLSELKKQLSPVNNIEAFKLLFDMIDRRLLAIAHEGRPLPTAKVEAVDDECSEEDNDDSSSVDTWNMEDAELLVTFNDALDALNLESEQAVTLRRLLTDLDASEHVQAEQPVSAFIEEVVWTAQIKTSRRTKLSNPLKVFRRKGNAVPLSTQRTVGEGPKSSSRILSMSRAFGVFIKSRWMARKQR